MENIISENLLQLSAKSSTIQGNNFTLRLFTTPNPIPETSSTSYIELGECETILRQSYSIPQTEGLIIKKFDHQIETFVTSQVEFSVFDFSGNELNLSLCNNIGVQISFPIINSTNINYELARELSEQNIDIYNKSDSFYTDYCIPYSANNSDMIRDDRVKDIYKEVNFCYSNCTYEGVNYTTNKAIYTCKQIPTTTHQEVEHHLNINKVIHSLSNLGETLYNATNLKIFSCYNHALNVSSYIKNIGFWFGASCLFVELILLFTFIIGENIISVAMKKIVSSKLGSSPSSRNNTNDKQQQEFETINIENKTLREHTHKKSSISTIHSTLELHSEKQENTFVQQESNDLKVKYADDELYETVIKEDNPNCLKYFCVSLFGNIDLISMFCCRDTFELLCVKISIYILK